MGGPETLRPLEDVGVVDLGDRPAARVEVVGPLLAKNRLLGYLHPADLRAQDVELDVHKKLFQNRRHSLRSGLLGKCLEEEKSYFEMMYFELFRKGLFLLAED